MPTPACTPVSTPTDGKSLLGGARRFEGAWRTACAEYSAHLRHLLPTAWRTRTACACLFGRDACCHRCVRLAWSLRRASLPCPGCTEPLPPRAAAVAANRFGCGAPRSNRTYSPRAVAAAAVAAAEAVAAAAAAAAAATPTPVEFQITNRLAATLSLSTCFSFALSFALLHSSSLVH